MFTDQDKDDIRTITTEVMKEVVPELLEDFAGKYINPSFTAMQEQIDGLNGKFEGLNGKFEGLNAELQKRPTFKQIDLKLTNMENRLLEKLGDKPLERDRILDKKTNRVAQKLSDKEVFDSQDVFEIERITPVAVAPH